MKREYSTKQRQAIIELLKESSTHASAMDILTHLRGKGIDVSVATVYRTLDKLEGEGVVKKMTIGGGAGACYQYLEGSECNEHFHLKCIECGELIHLSCEFLAEMEKHIFSEHKFTISSGKTVIYGRCSRCMHVSDSEATECTSCHKH